MSRATRWIAREVAVGLAAPYTNPIAARVELGAAGYDAGRSFRRGAVGLARDRARQRVIVAGEWSHGASDRRDVLAQVGIDFLAFRDDVVNAASATADAQWVAAEVAPALAEWQTFVGRMAASPLASYVTNWSVFEAWYLRLLQLRNAARARGLHLSSPEPKPIPKTVWERGEDGTGATLDTWISLGRKVFFGALAVTGAVGLYATVRSVRSDLRTLVRRT